MVGSIKRTTANLGIPVPLFDSPQWGRLLEQGLDIIDSAIFNATGVSNWENSTDYVVGDRRFDEEENSLWVAQVNHTSAASGTFAEDRLANPSYWVEIDYASLAEFAGLDQTDNNFIIASGGVWTSQGGLAARTALGLGNVDNTSDADKPISDATQTALDNKQALSSVLTTLATFVLGTTGSALLQDETQADAKTTLGLENVNNTSDANKPISTATQAALDDKQPLAANLTTLAAATLGAAGLLVLAGVSVDDVYDALARDWSGGTSGAPTLSMPNIAERKYIDIGAFCSLTDTNDARAGIVAALAYGDEGREFVFTNPLGGTRYYRVKNRASGRIFLPQAKTFRLICEPGAIIDFTDFGNGAGLTSTPYFWGTGTVGTEHLLTVNAPTDTNTITVSLADVVNYARGDDIFVRSNGTFTTEEASLGTLGEWAFIVGVNTGTGVITLGAKLRSSYNTADGAYITKVTPISGSVENLNIIGAGRFADNNNGDRALQIINGKNFKVIGGNYRFCDFHGPAFTNVLNGLVDGVRVEFDAKGATTGLQYGVAFVNMCENTWGRNCDINGGSEGLVLSSTGQPQGVCRDVGFESCRVRGSTRSGACTHDNHENWYVINCTFEDCEQGIDHRINGLVATGNTMRRMGAYSGSLSCGIQLGSGAGKVIFSNNVLEDMLRGVYHPDIIDETATGPVGDIMISGNVMRKIGQYCVVFDVHASDDTTARGNFKVIGNDFDMTAGFGVEIEGNWDKPVVAQNTFRGGNGGRCVYLHNTSAGGTTGPISPTVVGNRYENYTEPLIQHSTGRWIIKDNEDMDATSLPSVASASALTIPTNGNDVFVVTGTTTINTILRAAEYVGKVITLMFSASLTVTHNANVGAANDIQLAGSANFAATANDQLMLVSNGTVWREISRTAI